MAHTVAGKSKLLNRVRRIRGQVAAVEKALNDERDCYAVLQMIAACHGAINGLMREVIEGHIRYHITDPSADPRSERAKAAQELITVLRSYLT